jgi:NifU-like protein
MTPLELLNDHAQRPRNIGKLLNASAIGDVGSIVVGDALRFYIAVADGRITAAKFQVFNCSDQIGSASAVTELIVGKTLDEAKHLRVSDVRHHLGDLATEHLPPRLWALEGLYAAIAVHEGHLVETDHEHDPLTCRCHGVTENTVRQSITIGGATNLEEIVAATNAGTGCGSCKPDIIKVLDEVTRPAEAPAAAPTPAKPSVAGRIQTLLRIQRLFAANLAPKLREQGGDLELWDFDGRLVRVHLRGSFLTDDAAARHALEELELLLKKEIDPTLGVMV